MTGLTTIENGPYVSPISLILTEVDGAYREPKSLIRNDVIDQE